MKLTTKMWLWGIGLLGLFLLTTAGWALKVPTGTPKKGGIAIIGLSQEPTQFNPILSLIEVDRGVQYAIFDSPWRLNDQGEFVPNLATEIPSVQNGGISPDGLEYTFKFKQGVKWHDGAPFSARDVKFTFDLLMNPKVNTNSRVGHDKVESLELVDDSTIKIRLKEPYALFLTVWSDTHILPEHILGKMPPEEVNTSDFNSRNPIGTGPFKLVERVAGDHITLEANPDYHGEGPYLDRVIIKYIPDLTVLYTQFKTGEIDATLIQGISLEHYEDAKSLSNRNIFVYGSSAVENIYFNLSRPQFKEKAVRQAIYYGIDKEIVIEKVYNGLPPNAESYIPPNNWAYNPNLPKHEYNPEKAKQLLDEAGWKDTDGDGIREKNGVKLSFTNSTTAGNKLREQAQQLFQQQLRLIGVDMQIKNFPPAVVWGEYYYKSQFDTVMVGWQVGLGGDPEATIRFHSKYIPIETGTGRNTLIYKNPKVDSLLEQGAREIDREKRKEIYYRIQEIMREELPFLPIFNFVTIRGTKKGFLNYKPNVYTVENSWNIYEWGWVDGKRPAR